VKENVPVASAVTRTRDLPLGVQEALGELVGAAKDGLLALSVGVGLGVLTELMEEEVEEVVGPKGKHDRDRTAVRHGHDPGEVTLGGRRVAVERPRVRTVDDEAEVALATYAHFADRDPLTREVFAKMLAGVSTRRFRRTREPVGTEVEQTARSTSKSAVSREFVARTRENLNALMARRLDDMRLAVMMIDGIDLKGRTNVVALGITTEGVKIPLGLWEGSAGHPVRDRRRQSAQEGDPDGVRRPGSRAALRASQRTKCARTPGRARPPDRQAAPAPGVEARRSRQGTR